MNSLQTGHGESISFGNWLSENVRHLRNPIEDTPTIPPKASCGATACTGALAGSATEVSIGASRGSNGGGIRLLLEVMMGWLNTLGPDSVVVERAGEFFTEAGAVGEPHGGDFLNFSRFS